jgi:hypothetical protein
MVDNGDETTTVLIMQLLIPDIKRALFAGMRKGFESLKARKTAAVVPSEDQQEIEKQFLDTRDDEAFRDSLRTVIGDDEHADLLNEVLSEYKSLVEKQMETYNLSVPNEESKAHVDVMLGHNEADPDKSFVQVQFVAPKEIMPQMRVAHDRALQSIIRGHGKTTIELDGALAAEVQTLSTQHEIPKEAIERVPNGVRIQVDNKNLSNVQELADCAAVRNFGTDVVATVVPDETVKRLLREQNSKWRKRGLVDSRTNQTKSIPDKIANKRLESHKNPQHKEGAKNSSSDSPELAGKGRGVPDIEGTKSPVQEFLIARDVSDKDITMSTIFTTRENAETLLKDLKALGSNPSRPRLLSHAKLAPDKTTPAAVMRMAKDVAESMSAIDHDHPEHSEPTK